MISGRLLKATFMMAWGLFVAAPLLESKEEATCRLAQRIRAAHSTICGIVEIIWSSVK
jgi:hypothetical protein